MVAAKIRVVLFPRAFWVVEDNAVGLPTNRDVAVAAEEDKDLCIRSLRACPDEVDPVEFEIGSC